MSWSQQDIDFMREALAEAAKAAKAGEVPVGAVLVENDRICARGHNLSCSNHDPSGHAEITVLRDGGRARSNHRLAGATLYVTLEPCVMCTGAIVQARIDRVVFAAYDKKAGALGSAEDLADSPAFNHRFEVNGGLLADESAALLQTFFNGRR